MPFKGQRVNLDLFYDLVEVLKTPESLAKKRSSGVSIVEPLKKIGFLSNFFNKNEEQKEKANEPIANRFIAFYEKRILVMNEIPDQIRSYGSHFSVKDKDKL